MKILNPVIWVLNLLRYFSHLEAHRNSEEYQRYDFQSDIKYF